MIEFAKVKLTCINRRRQHFLAGLVYLSRHAALLMYKLLVLIAFGSFCLDEGDSLQLASQMTPVLEDPAARESVRGDLSALITVQTAADRGGAAPGETKLGS